MKACTSGHAACSTHKCTTPFRISSTAFLIYIVHTCPTSPMPTCAGGVSTRLVQCIHSSNGTVSEGSCVAPAPASNMSCNMDPCDFCQENVCSGEGTCVGQACQCDPGYVGSYCQVQCCFTACCLPLRCKALLHASSSQFSAMECCVATQCYKHPCLHCYDPKDLATPHVCENVCACVCVFVRPPAQSHLQQCKQCDVQHQTPIKDAIKFADTSLQLHVCVNVMYSHYATAHTAVTCVSCFGAGGSNLQQWCCGCTAAVLSVRCARQQCHLL